LDLKVGHPFSAQIVAKIAIYGWHGRLNAGTFHAPPPKGQIVID
jgi:hypothetical protein